MKIRALVVLALSVAACGDSSEPPAETETEDVATSDTIASFDTGPDAGSDVPEQDVARDFGTVDTPEDSVADVEADSDVDAAEDSDSDATSAEGVATIGPEGGSIETDYARLIVPAGALSRPTELRVQQGGEELLPFPEGFLSASEMIGFFPEGQAFSEPVTVGIPIDDSNTVGMQIWWSPITLAFWGPEETEFDGEWAFAEVYHFSQGFVGRPDGAYCGDGVAEDGEECDADDLRGLDCADFELSGEAANCLDDCTIDLSGCSDPCDGVVCDDAPAPTCRTDVRVSFSGDGVCVGGTCEYTEVTEECDLGGCYAGECQNTPNVGDIVISEFLVDPDGEDAPHEWFELVNISPRRLYIGGLLITDDGSDRIQMPAGTWLEPGAYSLFVGSTAAVPGAPGVDWNLLGNFSLNSSDAIEVSFQGRLIDRVEYDLTWVIEPSTAQSLTARDVTATANDTSDSWCNAYGDYGLPPNTGTPGTPNPPCAVCGDGVIETPEECDDGAREPGDGCDENCRIEADLCEGVVCDSPPRDECASDTALRQWTGTCDSGTGECTYEPAVYSCAEDFVCVLSACRPAIVPGTVVISEIMAIPEGGGGQEWFEISSFAPTALDLSGMTVSGGARAEGFNVPFGTVLPANGTLVFGATAGAAGGMVSAVWTDTGTFGFSDGGDAVELTYGGERVHRVQFDPAWPVFLSASMQREDTKPFEEFETSNGWCLPGVLYDPANAGTPGSRSHDCPLCGNGVLEDGEDCDDGNLEDGDGCSSSCIPTE